MFWFRFCFKRQAFPRIRVSPPAAYRFGMLIARTLFKYYTLLYIGKRARKGRKIKICGLAATKTVRG
jgi:hypothetical protein